MNHVFWCAWLAMNVFILLLGDATRTNSAPILFVALGLLLIANAWWLSGKRLVTVPKNAEIIVLPEDAVKLPDPQGEWFETDEGYAIEAFGHQYEAKGEGLYIDGKLQKKDLGPYCHLVHHFQRKRRVRDD